MCSLMENRYLLHFFALCGESIVTYDKTNVSNVSNVSETYYGLVIKSERSISDLNVLFLLDFIKKI